MKRLLLIEDEENIRTGLADFLRAEGFEVITAASVKEARECLREKPALVLLDWALPDGSGVELLREWRNSRLSLPVIMLTARSHIVDKVLGLELGADDYVTKPFEPRELLARIHVRLRSPNALASDEADEPKVRCFADIEMNFETREVRYRQQRVELSKMEWGLLALFIDNPGRVFTRDEILNQVWGFENYPTTRTVDTHILQLRQKLNPQYFETLRGVGYRLVGDVKRTPNENLTKN